MKLTIDSKPNRESLQCIACIAACEESGQAIEVSRSTAAGLDKPVLSDEASSTFTPIVSGYAICRYLLATRTLKKTTKLTLSSGTATWKDENDIFWSFSTLNKALDGVNKSRINEVLSSLECRLKGDQRRTGDSGYTLADVFLWSTVRISRSYPVIMSQTSEWPALRSFMAAVDAADFAQQAVSIVLGQAAVGFGMSGTANKPTKETYYITTAINYTNGAPHIGHAYESVVSDVIARYHRVYGREVFFLTGTDEHGQKIANTAAQQGKEPIEICDFYAAEFQALNALLDVSNDHFVRTTSDSHKRIAQKLWQVSQENGDIYLGQYVGWYNVREETFVTERDAEAAGYKDPISGVPLQKMQESSFFFKMSKYQNALLKHIADHPEFIQPEYRRNEILARLKEPLEDLSISRTNLTWGVPVPGEAKHVMYVWFDALSNYLSGIGYLNENEPNSRFWPAACHMIGKDITWFHCVIWPTILMSAKVPLPKSVFAHGFVVAADGRKMSKSLGNVVDPVALLRTLSNPDTFRFFVVKAAELGRDLRFDMDAMTDMHNGDLADTIGNMVHRATGLCQKFCDGKVPDCSLPDGEPPFNFEIIRMEVERLFGCFCLQEALEVIMSACRDTNKYLTDMAPWAVSDLQEKRQICRAILEALYLLAHLLEPYIPRSAEEIFRRLGMPRQTLESLSGYYDNLRPGAPVSVGTVLFEKRETKAV